VGSLCNTLTELRIDYLHKLVPLSELRQVHALCQLRELTLDKETFDRPLEAYAVQHYQPPSLLMPQLQKSVYKWGGINMVSAAQPSGVTPLHSQCSRRCSSILSLIPVSQPPAAVQQLLSL